jgi:hypothetical protein
MPGVSNLRQEFKSQPSLINNSNLAPILGHVRQY